MKKLILIFFILFSSSLYSQKFLSVKMLPILSINKDSIIENSLFFSLAWNPNNVLNNSFYIGILDGFTLGTSLGFNYYYPNLENNKWYFSTGLNLPFFIQVKNTVQSYYTGLNYDLGFSFSLNNEKKLYVYLAPISFFILPFNWIDKKNQSMIYDNKTYFYYSFIIGLRKHL